VKEWLENYKAKRREAQWMDSTLRCIATLCYGDIGKVLNSPTGLAMGELLKHNVILELDALTNSDKTFLIESIMLWIHHYRLQERERETFKHAIIIEEAHHILLRRKESKETVMDIILREIRELGEAIVLIDQHPSLISIPSIGNTYTTIAMNLKHGRDINTIGEAMLLTDEQKEYLGKLPIGYGIVKLQSRHYKPFLIKFPFVQVKKGSVIDENIRTWFKGYSEKFEGIPGDLGKMEVIQDIQSEDNIGKKIKLDEKERELIEDIVKFPVNGVADRFGRLNITAYKGYEVLSRLMSSGLVESNFVATGKSRVRFLQLSEKARRILGTDSHYPASRGGPEHEYWKYKNAEELKKRGYAVEFERQIDGHRVDIFATKNGENIAVEIETGMSDAAANIERNFRAGFPRVICVTLSDNTTKEINETFAAEVCSGKLVICRSVSQST
jgi:hypothetical protein